MHLIKTRQNILKNITNDLKIKLPIHIISVIVNLASIKIKSIGIAVFQFKLHKT